MKVIGYVRLSRDSREESTSVVRQREIIAAHAAARDWDLVEIVEDVGLSASKRRLDRPGLTEVRRRIDAGEAEAVIVWRLDRLVRSVSDVGTLLDEGLQIISATENLDTTSMMGRAMVEILQVFASMESKTIGVRVSAARQHLQRVGRWAGGPVPYGYRAIPHPDGVGRGLEPDPEESAIVRRMVDALLAGRTIYSICQELNLEGVSTRKSSTWHQPVVRSILRRGTLLGRVRVGTITPDGKRHEGDWVRDEETGLPISFWPPIITLAEHERIRALTERTPTPGRGELTRDGRRKKATRLLSGMIVCPSCDRPLTVKNNTNPRGYTYYTCASTSRGWHCPDGVTGRADYIEETVERRFLEEFGDWRVFEARRLEVAPVGMAEIDEGIRETTDAMRVPGADIGGLVARLSALQAERERLDALPRETIEDHQATRHTFAEQWASGDLLARRGLLQTAGARIVLERRGGGRNFFDPTRVRIAYAEEFAA